MYIIIKAEKKDSMKKFKTSQSEKKTYYIQSIRMAIVFSPESMKATDTGVIFLKHKKKKKILATGILYPANIFQMNMKYRILRQPIVGMTEGISSGRRKIVPDRKLDMSLRR